MNAPNQQVPTVGRTDKTAVCCIIDCNKPATKLVYPRVGNFADSYTHACDDHVEDLKENEDDVVEALRL